MRTFGTTSLQSAGMIGPNLGHSRLTQGGARGYDGRSRSPGAAPYFPPCSRKIRLGRGVQRSPYDSVAYFRMWPIALSGESVTTKRS